MFNFTFNQLDTTIYMTAVDLKKYLKRMKLPILLHKRAYLFLREAIKKVFLVVGPLRGGGG